MGRTPGSITPATSTQKDQFYSHQHPKTRSENLLNFPDYTKTKPRAGSLDTEKLPLDSKNIHF